MKFQVGDWVRVYGPIEDAEPKVIFTPGSTIVLEVLAEHADCLLLKDNIGCEYRANKKQCRKLVKKERRRAWVLSTEAGTSAYIGTKRPPGLDWIEFVEVKKK